MEEKKTIPVTPPVTAARRVFPVDGRDRALLVLAWGVGVLCAEALLWGLSGLVMTLLAAAWYGVLFWYGGAAPLARRENRLLLYAVGLLALTFVLFANPWLRLWNTLALVLLMGIQMGGWPGMEVYSVGTSAMWGERFLRVMGGLFGYLGAPVQALGSIRGLSRKKMPYVLGALLVCVPLLMVLFPLLTSADALFAQVTRRAADWFDEHLALWALRLIFGLLVAIPVRAALLPSATGGAEAAYGALGGPFNGGRRAGHRPGSAGCPVCLLSGGAVRSAVRRR